MTTSEWKTHRWVVEFEIPYCDEVELEVRKAVMLKGLVDAQDGGVIHTLSRGEVFLPRTPRAIVYHPNIPPSGETSPNILSDKESPDGTTVG